MSHFKLKKLALAVAVPHAPLYRGAVLGVALSMGATNAFAFQLDTGNPDLRVRWDNTLKYSAAARTTDRNSKLSETDVAINYDDGDRNFDKGLISNRLDLLSEVDVSYKNVGARISGAAWYDSVYNDSNDNDAPGRVNHLSSDYDEFTSDTEKLHGRKGELLDAFVFGRGTVGELPASFRLGQFAQQWGESMFYGMNGIAGGMAPIDAVKALSVPNTQFKELIRPVEQVSGQLQLTPDVSVAAYYQFEWEETRLPAAGSYFSSNDFFGEGSERMIVGGPIIPGGGPAAFFRGQDEKAKDSGQGGLQVRWRTENVDWGLYAIRFHDKTPQLNVRAAAGLPNFATGQVGEYYWVYPEDISAVGASFSTTVESFNFAGELSTRWDQPLASTRQRPLAPGEAIDNGDDPLYATGRTLHAQVSWLATLGPTFLSQEATWIGEVAWNRRLSVTKNADAMDPNASRDAWSLRTVYEPMYRQVSDGLDLSVPVGFGYTHGKSSALGPGFGPNRGGDVNIGVAATYLSAWKAGLTYTHYYGPQDTQLDGNFNYTYDQTLKDRDFLSLTVSRTF
ncbi:hypothetical protein D3C78_617000 [compost metagenome]